MLSGIPPLYCAYLKVNGLKKKIKMKNIFRIERISKKWIRIGLFWIKSLFLTSLIKHFQVILLAHIFFSFRKINLEFRTHT